MRTRLIRALLHDDKAGLVEALQKREHELAAMADQRHQHLQQKYGLPFRVQGTNYEHNNKFSYICQTIFQNHQINQDSLNSYLFKIFRAVFLQLPKGKSPIFQAYLESSFKTHLLQSLSRFAAQGYSLRTFEDTVGDGSSPVELELKTVDFALVRGLDMDRSKNMSYNEYHQMVEHEDMGLSIYTPLNLTDPDNFKIKDDSIYQNYKKIIFRIFLSVKSSLRAEIQGQDLDLSLETWQHGVLFQSQMIPPPKFDSQYKLQTYMEWFSKFRFGKWFISDIDLTMSGNPLLTKDTPRQGYDDKIFKGSKYDLSQNIDLRKAW